MKRAARSAVVSYVNVTATWRLLNDNSNSSFLERSHPLIAQGALQNQNQKIKNKKTRITRINIRKMIKS